MAFKFPFTNYHELNLTWVLDQLKSLFEKSEENVTVIENYNGRLTAVETELPLVSETAQDAAQNAAAASSLAQQAKSTADTAQENAIQAQGAAGQARQEAQAAQAAADAATQAAQQAQAAAQNFDGRITQAQNNAAAALEASRSFENRVQSAITTANNAAQTATNAQGIATRADQNAALALDTLNAQRSELERIGAEQVERITEETESGKTEIENLAQSVLDSIPSDYTALSNLVDKKAPVIINSASGAVASFNDGADNMKIQKLVVNIEPVQAGSGAPSPDNVRPISGWTGVEIKQAGKNLVDISNQISVTFPSEAGDNGTVYGGTLTLNPDRTGTLVVDRLTRTYNGAVSEGWDKYSNTAFFIRIAGKKSGYSTSICDKYRNLNRNPAWVSSLFGVYSDHTDNNYMYFRPPYDGFDFGVANWRAWLAENPIKVVYILAKPQTYQLTAEQVSGIFSTLYGTNNIWADTGDVEVTYPADTKLYIDGKLAEIQATILENI